MKTPDQRALPRERSAWSREDAWATVVENDRLVKATVHRFVAGLAAQGPHFYGYTREALFEEFLPVAYEGALKAAEAFDPGRGLELSTLMVNVMRRDLINEIPRWIRTTGIDWEQEVSLDSLVEQYGDFAEVVLDLPAAPGPEDLLDAYFTFQVVHDALSEREYQVLTLTSDGYTPKEISERLGISDGNARVILHRARAKAKEALA